MHRVAGMHSAAMSWLCTRKQIVAPAREGYLRAAGTISEAVMKAEDPGSDQVARHQSAMLRRRPKDEGSAGTLQETGAFGTRL